MTTKIKKEDLHWVYQSMINWRELAKDKTKLKHVLSQGDNTFYFLKGQVSKDNIHAYLGIFNNNIFLHFVPNSSDIVENFKNGQELPSYIQSSIGNSEIIIGGWIETEEALKRIENWNDEKLRNDVLETNDLHRSFFIPNNNFEGNIPLKVKFALNENMPDLVIEQMGVNNAFYDTCRPVPPFPPYIKEDDFALLKVIDSWVYI